MQNHHIAYNFWARAHRGGLRAAHEHRKIQANRSELAFRIRWHVACCLSASWLRFGVLGDLPMKRRTFFKTTAAASAAATAASAIWSEAKAQARNETLLIVTASPPNSQD